MSNPYVTADEAVSILAVDPRTFRRWIEVGRIRPAVNGKRGRGHAALFVREDVAKLEPEYSYDPAFEWLSDNDPDFDRRQSRRSYKSEREIRDIARREVGLDALGTSGKAGWVPLGDGNRKKGHAK